VKAYHDEFIPEQVEEAVTDVAASSGNLFRYNATEQQ
jgi:hypothetical protein